MRNAVVILRCLLPIVALAAFGFYTWGKGQPRFSWTDAEHTAYQAWEDEQLKSYDPNAGWEWVQQMSGSQNALPTKNELPPIPPPSPAEERAAEEMRFEHRQAYLRSQPGYREITGEHRRTAEREQRERAATIAHPIMLGSAAAWCFLMLPIVYRRVYRPAAVAMVRHAQTIAREAADK